MQVNEKLEEALYEHHTFKVDKNQSPLRIDKFLMNFIENTTRNKIQNALKANNIWVNKKEVKPNYRIKPMDVIECLMAKASDYEVIAENIPLDIIYEDTFIMVINKPPGMVVHPAFGHYSGTLVHAIKYHLGASLLAKDDALERPGIVHRIDKDTSGLLLIAKDQYSLEHLAKQFFLRTIKREYLAFIWGDLPQETGTIKGHIGRNLKNRKQMQVFPEGDKGKHAITHYKVLERFGYLSFISCQLETGRTHQIRVHLSYIGHPIFNDSFYGGDRIFKKNNWPKYKQFIENAFSILPRQALHAHSIGFIHPHTKKNLYFQSPLPRDMAEALEKWRNLKKRTI